MSLSLIGIGGANAGRVVPIPPMGVLFGSDPAYCNLLVPSPEVAKQHARIFFGPDGLPALEEIAGTGVFLLSGGQWVRLQGPRVLAPGDRFRVGTGAEEFQLNGEPAVPLASAVSPVSPVSPGPGTVGPGAESPPGAGAPAYGPPAAASPASPVPARGGAHRGTRALMIGGGILLILLALAGGLYVFRETLASVPGFEALYALFGGEETGFAGAELNVRSDHSIRAPRVGLLRPGQRVRILETWKVESGFTDEGFMRLDAIVRADDGTEYEVFRGQAVYIERPNGGSLVRIRFSYQGRTVSARLPQEDWVEPATGPWLLVETEEGKKGWVYGKYVTKNP